MILDSSTSGMGGTVLLISSLLVGLLMMRIVKLRYRVRGDHRVELSFLFLLSLVFFDLYSPLTSGWIFDVSHLFFGTAIVLLSGRLSFEMVRSTRSAKQAEENEQLALLARATQMIAHDVRKPLSIVEALMLQLEAAENFHEVKMIMNSGAPQVLNAKREVDTLLSDIMEVGSRRKLSCEEVSLRGLIRSTVKSIFTNECENSIRFKFDLKHTRSSLVDIRKIQRVLSNILQNASQAIRKEGEIWIETQDVDVGGYHFIRVVIGNNGATIPQDRIPFLFDSFFSHGKKNGTGLGLAITKSILLAHGGTISVRSSDKEGTEFTFILPMGGKSDFFVSQYPGSSEECQFCSEGLEAYGASNEPHHMMNEVESYLGASSKSTYVA